MPQIPVPSAAGTVPGVSPLEWNSFTHAARDAVFTSLPEHIIWSGNAHAGVGVTTNISSNHINRWLVMYTRIQQPFALAGYLLSVPSHPVSTTVIRFGVWQAVFAYGTATRPYLRTIAESLSPRVSITLGNVAVTQSLGGSGVILPAGDYYIGANYSFVAGNNPGAQTHVSVAESTSFLMPARATQLVVPARIESVEMEVAPAPIIGLLSRAGQQLHVNA